jgi:hypothetical protein
VAVVVPFGLPYDGTDGVSCGCQSGIQAVCITKPLSHPLNMALKWPYQVINPNVSVSRKSGALSSLLLKNKQ